MSNRKVILTLDTGYVCTSGLLLYGWRYNAPRNIASMSLCWPERNCSSCFRHISSLSLFTPLFALFLSVLQLEMEKMTRVSTIGGCTMFCHLDAPANAISVCRDATQVKTRFTTQAKVPN